MDQAQMPGPLDPRGVGPIIISAFKSNNVLKDLMGPKKNLGSISSFAALLIFSSGPHQIRDLISTAIILLVIA